LGRSASAFASCHGCLGHDAGASAEGMVPPLLRRAMFLAGTAFKKTGSKKDVLLLCLNGIAFFAMAIIMVVGTLLFGP